MSAAVDGASRPARCRVALPGGEHAVELRGANVVVGGREAACDLAQAGETRRFSLLMGGRSWRFTAREGPGGRWQFVLAGREVAAEALGERAARIREMSAQGETGPRVREVRAPMPGLVVEVVVRAGDEVGAGDRVAVVEAMKMENELRAAAAGRVARVLVEAGAAVEKDQLLVEFETPR